MKKRSGRASQNQHHETLIYVVKNAQTHAVPMGKALHEARVYRTTERCWFLHPIDAIEESYKYYK